MEDNMQLELVSQRVDAEEVEIPQERPKERNFIEANTTTVSLDHLSKDCIIPTFRDSEKTISHAEFVEAMGFSVQQFFISHFPFLVSL